MQYYVYFLTNDFDKTLYSGVTNNLERRLYEHKNDLIDGFTKKYKTHKLVYFEIFEDSYSAISREKQIKKWRREKKDFLANQINPTWKDLSVEWYQATPITMSSRTHSRDLTDSQIPPLPAVGRDDESKGED